MEENVYIEFKNGQAPYMSDVTLNELQRMIKADIQNKVKIERIFAKLTSAIAGNEDCTVYSYIVGKNEMSIFYEGTLLIKGEHYIEVGQEGEESTTIQFKDWDVPAGSSLEFLYKRGGRT